MVIINWCKSFTNEKCAGKGIYIYINKASAHSLSFLSRRIFIDLSVSKEKKQDMSSDEQIPVVADVENAKKSDGASTAGEHNVDQVNDDEQVPQSDEKSSEGNEEEQQHKEETNGNDVEKTHENDDVNEKINNNKRDIDQVDNGNNPDDDEEEKKNGQTEEHDQEATVSSSANKKVKIMDPLVNENGGSGESDEANGTSGKVPNEELTVV